MTDGLDKIHDLNSANGLAGIVILAGGESRRMGTAKAKLTLPTHETLLDYHVRQAIQLNVPVMIADNERGFAITPELLNSPQSLISHISDYGSITNVEPRDTGGALVAIVSAMQCLLGRMDAGTLNNKNASWLMVMSCDSLIPPIDLWQKLKPFITQAVDKSVICLTDETHLYPLLGLYHLSVEPDLRFFIDGGQRQVMVFIKPMTQAIPIIKEWQPLTNLNTPEQFKRACAALYDL